MYTGRTLLIGALYHHRGNFSHLPGFMSVVGSRLENIPYDRNLLIPVLDEIVEEFTTLQGKIDNDGAKKLLVADDIMAAKSCLKDENIYARLLSEANVESSLQSCLSEALAIFHEHGLQITEPRLNIVDQFPEPYNQAGYSAIATDEGDWSQHGIEPGLYFVRDGLRPIYSKFLLVHELIHIALGAKSPMSLGRGLEEGLAEIVGSMFMSCQILGQESTKNLFIYNRLSYGFNHFWELYLDYTRQAAYLYHKFGMNGLIELINRGREFIKKTEVLCLAGRFSEISLPEGGWIKEVTDIVDFLCLTYGRNLSITPLAYYLARYIAPGKTTVEILTEANVSMEPGRVAIEELQNEVFISQFKSDWSISTFSDAQLLSVNGTLRYVV
jgi:hypothetical protein